MRWFVVSAALLFAACNVKVKVSVKPVAGDAPSRCYERGTTVMWEQLKSPPDGAFGMIEIADRNVPKSELGEYWLRGQNGEMTLCRPLPIGGQAWRFEQAAGAWQLRSRWIW